MIEVQRHQIRLAEHVRISVQEWENRAAQVRRALELDEIPASELAEVLRDFTFRDEAAQSWTYDGERWWTWVDDAWRAATPSGPLKMDPFFLEIVEVPPESDVPRLEYVATHVVPMQGLPAWSEPDGGRDAESQLDAGLDVMLIERHDDGWAYVECSNGWRAWVDGRLLEDVQ